MELWGGQFQIMAKDLYRCQLEEDCGKVAITPHLQVAECGIAAAVPQFSPMPSLAYFNCWQDLALRPRQGTESNPSHGHKALELRSNSKTTASSPQRIAFFLAD
ncbi:hypothetical protein UY3_15769 [Chelonia mydas]|uniref:Uncharacterized protein n=1 Tax=Chelonia mydas TaxID=8469 RepID=M7AVU1_CHEMY|nr:hypothetical protein UY3_15769 [Chelonia mydas]